MATRAPSKRPTKGWKQAASLRVETTPPRNEQLTSNRGIAAMRVVGVGASAGGLHAFIDLISAIPLETGLAFVLIQHLDPRHASMLVAILTGATALPVQEVVDRMRIERDQVYVIPPDTQLTVQDGILRLLPRPLKVPHRPLDAFFCSLAEDRKSDAIGVVLSGNDADGALGLQTIRDAGGITFAQSPESAKFDIMPRAAAMAADFVLPPGGIAERLVTIARQDDSREGWQRRRFGKNRRVTRPVEATAKPKEP